MVEGCKAFRTIHGCVCKYIWCTYMYIHDILRVCIYIYMYIILHVYVSANIIGIYVCT